MASTPVLLLGGGKMASALIDGWLAQGIDPAALTVVDPGEGTRAALRQRGLAAAASPAELPADFAPAVVLIAVKPQVIDDVLPPYASFAGRETVFLSIAAGRTLASLARHIGEDMPLVRAMPNTPAAVGRGMTVLCANARATDAQRTACDNLMAGVGETGWVDDERLMDAVTAISGSGPAYVFHMIECLAAAGEAQGLPTDLAHRLARATVVGAAELAAGSEAGAATLRANVTSPGGVTEAALGELRDSGALRDLMTRAAAAGVRRSRELSG